MNEQELSIEPVHCNECMGGVLRDHKQSFIYWTGRELINVPNFPARLCDLCGWREYDPRAVHWFYKTYGRPADGGQEQQGLEGNDLHGSLRQGSE